MRTTVLLGVCLFTALHAVGEKNYLTQFQVLFADRSPGDFYHIGSCSMRLRAGNRVYMVGVEDTFHPCVVFAPGTVLRGSDKRTFIDLVEDSGSKPKAHRYWVRDVELVSNQ